MGGVAAGFLLIAGLLGAPPDAPAADNLPADCSLAIHVDFVALRKTALYGRIEGHVDEFLRYGLGLQGLFERARCSPKDLVSITAGPVGDLADPAGFCAVAHGKFDVAHLKQSLPQDGFSVSERDGAVVFTLKDSPRAPAIALLGGDTFVLVKPGAELDAFLAAQKKGATSSGVHDLLAGAAAGQIQAAFVPSDRERKEMAAEPDCAPIADLRSALLTYTLGDGLKIAVAARAGSEEGAKTLVAFLEKTAGGIGAKERAKIERDGAAVKASCSLSLQEAVKLMGLPADLAREDNAPQLAEGAPALKGDGKLFRLALAGQVNSFAVSPGDRYVYVDRALHPAVVLGGSLRVLQKKDGVYGWMGFSSDGRTGAWMSYGSVTVRGFPDLHSVAKIEPPLGAGSGWAVLGLPSGRFAFVTWGGVFFLDPGTKKWTGPVRLMLRKPIAGAYDPATGRILAVGDTDGLEIVDPKTMQSEWTLSLPCKKVAYDVVAVGGRAWVATREGTFVPVDLAARRAGKPVEVGKGRVKLSLSASGRMLAALAQASDGNGHYPSTARVYEVSKDGSLRQTHSASFVALRYANDIAILEISGMVLTGGRESLVWQYR